MATGGSPTDVAQPFDTREELTLDPEDWQAFKDIAHQALDEALEFVQSVRERPVWKPVPDTARAEIAEGPPWTGQEFQDVYAQFKTSILPYATGNIHPRFFGWVHGSGQPGNIVAELLAAAMNSNCGGRDHGAIYVENAVIAWCRELFGFPEESSGLIVSGTSMANLVGIGVARNARLKLARRDGYDASQSRLVVYASREVHQSVVKTLEILGLGAAALHKIEVDSDLAIDVQDLKRAIAEDRSAGRQPFCCVGCAGTVNTGAIDDLETLAEICRQEGIWFHVDGAFGSLCIMSDELKGRLVGIEKADSLAFDFHKWAHVQYDAACILVRNADLHRQAYSMRPPYLQHLDGGLGGGGDWPCDFGPELSRSFRALKIWFALKEHGFQKLGRLIEQNCRQAQHLAERIRKEPDLELVAPVVLNIVCFRCVPPGLKDGEIDRLNEEIVVALQRGGVAAPSTSRINGKLAIRVNLTNHRTKVTDLDLLIDTVIQLLRSRTPAV